MSPRVAICKEFPHGFLHPVVIAVNAAMFDHLSQGRFVMGISAGALTSDSEAIGILDLDSTSWVISHPNRDLTLRIGALAATIATDGWLARRLPGLLESAGFEDVSVRAFTPLERDPAGIGQLHELEHATLGRLLRRAHPERHPRVRELLLHGIGARLHVLRLAAA